MTEAFSSSIRTMLITHSSYTSQGISQEPSNGVATSTSDLQANTSASDIVTDVAGNPYADEDAVNIMQLVITVVITLCGCVGNTLVVLAVFTHRRLRNLGNAFVVNLAVADLCVSAFINAFAIAGLITKGTFFETQDTLCQAIGVICVTR